ncbi:MAG: hypothetical protein ABSD31_17410 [Candidatus Binataceae bacterium]|jgi:hypothetical protein
MFEETVGLPPEIYFPLVFACMAKYQTLSAENFYRSPNDFALRLDWFGQTRLGREKLERFFGDVAGDYEQFTQLLAQFNKGVNDFTAFRERPILRLGDCFYPMDFGFLAAKSETAFFWRVHNSLSAPQRDDFHTFWGRLFERYMHRLMKLSIDRQVNCYYESPRYADRENDEACDGIMVCKGHVAVVMEFKGSVFTANAKYGDDPKTLEQEIGKKLIGQEGGDRKGVKQLAHAISSLFQQGRQLRDMDLSSITTVYPLLVTRDEIGSTWYLTSYLNEVFKKAVNKKKIRATVTPLFCVCVDDFEAFAGVLKTVALSDILKARYRQDKTLRLPFLLPNNEALSGIRNPSPTVEEASTELERQARRLFEFDVR